MNKAKRDEYKEAKQMLDRMRPYFGGKAEDAIDLARTAISRHIRDAVEPMKGIGHGGVYYFCPNCIKINDEGYCTYSKKLQKEDRFCPNCGIELDWRNEE